jgi:hypothetical protein
VAALAGVRLRLRDVGNDQRVLDAALQRADGRVLSVRPPGSDAVALYRSLAAVIPSQGSRS